MFSRIAGILLLSLFFINNIYACTAFASTEGKDGSVIIAKNRDEHPGLQSVVAFHPVQGYRFVALVSRQNTMSPYVVRSGTNQFDLTIVNMAAGYVLNGYPNFNPDRYNDGDDFMRNVLTHYRSIDEVIKNLPSLVQQFPYPEFYILADNKETALIEVAPGHQYSLTVSDSKPVYHTNHYTSPLFASYNLNYDQSSLIRYERISELMHTTSSYSIQNFIDFANDHNSDDNDSIFRTNQTSGAPRTLATYIAEISKSQNEATIYIDFYPKPIRDGSSYEFKLDKKFWEFHDRQKVLAIESMPVSTMVSSS